MLKSFIVKFVGGIYEDPYSCEIGLEDGVSAICGYVSWCLLHYRADLVLLFETEKDGGELVAMAEKKVLVTLKQHNAADITKLI